ncbi:hypothetical protein AAES_140924 [Amazona aestiva]|uniref:Uncharacterized protein n=1 Tax=Amazona aestiva TaxID=12930 RepID=A0A0Q3PIS1_AMAAE|nr:hypothetical protein AAES_140924 [Amazona aestiva]
MLYFAKQRHENNATAGELHLDLCAAAFDIASQDASLISQIEMKALEPGEAASEMALGEGTINVETPLPGLHRRRVKLLATSKDLDGGRENML